MVNPRGLLCCCINVSTERQTVPPVPPVPAAMGMAPAFCPATPAGEQSSAQGWRHQEPTRGRAPCSAQLLCTNTALQGFKSGCFLWHGTSQGSVCQKFHAVLGAKRDISVRGHPSLPPPAAPGCSKAGSCHSYPRAPRPRLLRAPGMAGLCPSLPLPAARESAQPALLLVPAPGASSDGAELSLQQAGCKDELFPSGTMSAVPAWKIFIFLAW